MNIDEALGLTPPTANAETGEARPTIEEALGLPALDAPRENAQTIEQALGVPPLAPNIPRDTPPIEAELGLPEPPDSFGVRLDKVNVLEPVLKQAFEIPAQVAALGMGARARAGQFLRGRAESFVAGNEIRRSAKEAGLTEIDLGPSWEEKLQVEPPQGGVQDTLLYRSGDSLVDWSKQFDPFLLTAGLNPKNIETLKSLGGNAAGMIAMWGNPTLGISSAIDLQRDEQYQDAVAHGADEDAALLAGDFGSLAGTIEFLSYEAAFRKLSELPGGKQVMEVLKKLPRDWPQRVARGIELGLTGLTESLEEALQQVWGNLTAKDWVGYDPDRPWNETLAGSAAGGFGQGVFLDALAKALGLRRGAGVVEQALDTSNEPDPAGPGLISDMNETAPMFIDQLGRGYRAGGDHGIYIDEYLKLGPFEESEDQMRAVTDRGLYYVDFGNPQDPLVIAGEESGNTREASIEAARNFADRLGHPVRLAFGPDMETVAPRAAPGPSIPQMTAFTTRMLDALPEDGTLNRKSVTRLFGKENINPVEQGIVKSVLDTPGMVDAKGQVDVRALRGRLEQAIIPIKAQNLGTGSGLNASYGVGNVIKDAPSSPYGAYFTTLWAKPRIEQIQAELDRAMLLDSSMHTPEQRAARISPDTPLPEGFLDQDVSQNEGALLPLQGTHHTTLKDVLERWGLNSARMPTTYGEARTRLHEYLIDDTMPQIGMQVFNAPFRSGIEGVKFHPAHASFITQNYLGHVRSGFLEPKTNPGVHTLLEDQADLTQKRPEKGTPRELRAGEQAQISEREAALRTQQTILQELQKESESTSAMMNVRAFVEKAKQYLPEIAQLDQQTFLTLQDVQKAIADALGPVEQELYLQDAAATELETELRGADRFREAGEQAQLNRQLQWDIAQAVRNGARKYRIPTLHTMAALQYWHVQRPDGTVVPASSLDPIELQQIDPKNVVLRTADHPEWFNPSTKQKRYTALAKFLFDHYRKYHNAKSVEDMRVLDKQGYDWYEIPLTEEIAHELEQVWGFPGPMGRQISDAFAQISQSLVGPGGLLRRLGLPHEVDAEYQSHLDKYGKWVQLTYGLTHLVDLNPHIEGLRLYTDGANNFWNTKTLWTSRASNTLAELRDKFSPERRDKLSGFMLEVTVLETRKQRALTDAELADVNTQGGYNLTDEEIAVWEGTVNRDFRAALEELYNVQLENIRREFTNNRGVLQTIGYEAKKAELDEMYNDLRGRHYFPLTRYGDYFVTVTTTRDTTIDGRRYKTGDVIEFRTFEGTFATTKQRAYFEKMKQRPGVSVEGGKFSEKQPWRSMLPRHLKRMIESQVDELSEAQLDQLAGLLVSLTPTAGMLKHMTQRKATPGFSLDAERGYAQYFQQFSNYIAREKHKAELNDAIANVEKTVRGIQDEKLIANTRQDIANHLRRHMEYLFDPGNEAAGFRAAAFIFYIGFYAKSAWVNLSQPMMTTYPYLAATYGGVGKGDVKSVYNLSKAYVDLAGDRVAAHMGLAARHATEGLVNPRRIEPELAEAISRGVMENFLEESFATELAAIAEGNLISRMAHGRIGRYTRNISHAASYIFAHAEKLNRRVSFIAAFRLARESLAGPTAWENISPATREQIYQLARKSVISTQYEYARWNRPELMRGPTKSTIFVFQQFVLNELHFVRRSPGRGRHLLMLFALGGTMGLPGAEDFFKILEALLNSATLRRMFGFSLSPIVDLRADVREYISELTSPDTADLVMHGLGRNYGLGPLHLLSLFNVPIPNLDISGSIGQGKILPALPEFMNSLSKGADFNTAFSNAIEDVAGAAWAMPFSMLEAVATSDPGSFRSLEGFLINALERPVKAVRAAQEGAYRTRSGRKVLDVDATDPAQFAELVAYGAGFQPSRLSIEYEKSWNEAEHISFYKSRQAMLHHAYVRYRVISPDREQLKVVEEQIDKYNSNAPSRLRIRGDDRARWIRAAKKAERNADRGQPRERKYRQVSERLNRIYPERE